MGVSSCDERDPGKALSFDADDGVKRSVLNVSWREGIQVRVIDAPPSTSEAGPVTKDESSDARYSTERASSSGFATRLSACNPVTKACDSVVSFMPRYISVSTAPGRMALTRTPCGPYSAASACVSPIKPAL